MSSRVPPIVSISLSTLESPGSSVSPALSSALKKSASYASWLTAVNPLSFLAAVLDLGVALDLELVGVARGTSSSSSSLLLAPFLRVGLAYFICNR